MFCSMALSAGQQTLAAAQRLEERALQKALKERRDEVGPPAGLVNPSHQAPATPAFSFRLPPRPQAAAQPQDSFQSSSGGANAMSGQAQTQPGTSMPGGLSQQHGAGHQQANSRGQQPEMQISQGGASPGRQPSHTAPPGFVPFGSSKS